MTKGRKPPARRNPIALRIQTLGQKVKPSGKIYKRQEKYRNRRRKDDDDRQGQQTDPESLGRDGLAKLLPGHQPGFVHPSPTSAAGRPTLRMKISCSDGWRRSKARTVTLCCSSVFSTTCAAAC